MTDAEREWLQRVEAKLDLLIAFLKKWEPIADKYANRGRMKRLGS